MDNAGENKKFMEVARSNEWNIKAKMECTSRSTPQQNNLVEIYGWHCTNKFKFS
jgi:hypothetical protein